MKKLLVLFLVLAITGGAFAQITPFGEVRLDFGMDVDLEESDDNAWHFALPGEAYFGANFEAGPVDGFIRVNANTSWKADAGVKFGDVRLSVGVNELPWAQWSSLAVWGDSNWATGASSSTHEPYLQVAYSAGEIFVYGGLQKAADAGGNIPSGMGPDNFLKMKDWYVFPGFYLGGDYTTEAFAVGAAFGGVPRGKAIGLLLSQGEKEESVFSWMANLHGKVFLDPITIGVNVAFYGAPAVGFFALDDFVFGYTKKDMVLEAMLDFGFDAGIGNLGLTAAFMTNLASKDDMGKGTAMKIGASFAFDVEGFKITPGIICALPITNPGDAGDAPKGNMGVGISFGYAF